jgi:hypothetical protein
MIRSLGGAKSPERRCLREFRKKSCVISRPGTRDDEKVSK